MIEALTHIKRMRGGSQAQLIRCSDGGYYVVKFQNNPQGVRILANEMLATALAAHLGLPVRPFEVVSVSTDLICHSKELSIQLGRGRMLCQSGLQFGSWHSNRYKLAPVYDFLDESELDFVCNVSDFLGMFVFDQWTCNTDGRQAIFVREPVERRYTAFMIDNGLCFNGAEWNFPDSPLRGLYRGRSVYKNVMGIDAFESWIAGIEGIKEDVLRMACFAIPSEWYKDDFNAIDRLLDQLWERRRRVADLILTARKLSPNVFPNWI